MEFFVKKIFEMTKHVLKKATAFTLHHLFPTSKCVEGIITACHLTFAS